MYVNIECVGGSSFLFRVIARQRNALEFKRSSMDSILQFPFLYNFLANLILLALLICCHIYYTILGLSRSNLRYGTIIAE
jgi:hypothetical protein